MNRFKKIIKFICAAAAVVLSLAALALVVTNIYVRQSVKKRLLDEADAVIMGDFDCIIVMGASVYADGSPSPMLEDRLKEGIALYKAGASDVIIMSGDRTEEEYYDEVEVMKLYAMDAGVPEEDILVDPCGYSSYETMYRVAKLHGARRVLIVTQQYHLTRSVYDAVKLGMDAYGVPCAKIKYKGQLRRDIREILAVTKDFEWTIVKPKPDTMDVGITQW